MASDKFVCLDDFEKEGQTRIPSWYTSYYATGSDEEITLRDSQLAFKRYRLRPRILRDVSIRDLSTTIQGQPISFPVCISPTAFHKLAVPDGETATARAATSCGTLLCLSFMSSTTMADVIDGAPSALCWMNIYILKNRDITKHLIKEAERCGFKGIVITMDSPKLGNHTRTARIRMYDVLNERFVKAPNLDIADIPEVVEAKKKEPLLINYVISKISDSPTIEEVKWIKSLTKLPIIAKGVLTGESARLLAEGGVDGILVSAHGGRQLDCVPAPIDVLSEVVEAVRDYPVEVYMDGGIRTGTDVFKALAIGAKTVFIGRPILWGLACNGEEGASQVLEILRQELSLAMALSGCSKLSDIKSSMVVPESYYHNAKL